MKLPVLYAAGGTGFSKCFGRALSLQEKAVRAAPDQILKVDQVSVFGDVDKSVTFDFKPLSSGNETGIAQSRQVRIVSTPQAKPKTGPLAENKTAPPFPAVRRAASIRYLPLLPS